MFKKVMKVIKSKFFDFEDEFTAIMKLPPVLEYETYLSLKDRRLYLNDDVADDIFDDIGYFIQKWNMEDEGIPYENRKPIHLYINTNGGELNATMGLISMMKYSQTPIYTYVLGKAYSAGSLIFVAGHKRFMHEYASILIHEGSIFTIGATSKAQEQFDFIKKQEKMIKDFFVSRTKITPKLYDKMYKVEWYIASDEALELGLTHEIIGLEK